MADVDIEKLVLQDGKLFESVGGTPASTFLDLPTITIVDKLDMSPAEGGAVAFRFKLSFYRSRMAQAL
jgi:hypothetical protein